MLDRLKMPLLMQYLQCTVGRQFGLVIRVYDKGNKIFDDDVFFLAKT